MKTDNHFLNSLNHFSRKKISITLFFSLWLLVSFSLPRYYDAHNPYDHSWMTAMADVSFDKVFTYGPFSWIFMPDQNGLSFVKMLIRFFICLILFYPLIFHFYHTTWKKKGFFFLGILFILAAPYFKYDILFYLSFWFLALEKNKKSHYLKCSLLIWSLVAPLYKFSFLPLAILLNLIFVAQDYKSYRVPGIGLLIIFLGQIFIDSHFLAKLENAFGYSEYMAGYQPGTGMMSLAIVLVGLGFSMFLKNKYTKWEWGLVLCAAFIQYKHSVVLGTPGYAFYLFFLIMYFVFLRFQERWANLLSGLSLWMIPFYISYMGGPIGLLKKFSNSLMFAPNLPSLVQVNKNCDPGKKVLILDYFGDLIGSPCMFEVFPSVQFYGFSPHSRIADLNKDFYFRNNFPNISLSFLTFGNRNSISELSYIFENLVNDYELNKREVLSSLSRRENHNNFELRCSPDFLLTQLIFLKMKCSSPILDIYQPILGGLYKYPELILWTPQKSTRIFYSSLKGGSYSYLGSNDDIFSWWNGEISVGPLITKPVVKVVDGGGILASSLENDLNKCLELSYCRFEQRSKK